MSGNQRLRSIVLEPSMAKTLPFQIPPQSVMHQNPALQIPHKVTYHNVPPVFYFGSSTISMPCMFVLKRYEIQDFPFENSAARKIKHTKAIQYSGTYHCIHYEVTITLYHKARNIITGKFGG